MNKISRRDYLKTTAAFGGSVLLPSFVIGKPGVAAASKLNIALVGGGGIAKTAFGSCRDHNVVAIADVDQERGALGFKEFPKAKCFKDFRRMLDAHYNELDLVIVSTPDHTHFPVTYAAMERGIAVHTQKPLTHNIWQARTLKKAAHQFNVQTVMGNQGHTFEGMRMIREWYEADMVGTVREVHAWTNRTTRNRSNAKLSPLKQPVPRTLDWDLWVGPAKMRDYNETYCPSGWRWWWDYGLGGLGDIGCHTLDIPIYAMQLGYPSKVYLDDDLNYSREAIDGKKAHQDAATYVYEFPAQGNRPAVKVYWYEGGRLPNLPRVTSPELLKDSLSGGCLLVGNKNTIVSPGMRPKSPSLLHDWMDLRRQLPAKTIPRVKGGPVDEIIGAIQGEIGKCGSNFDYAVPLTETVILGTIANRSGKVVEYKPGSMTFRDASLDFYIKEPVRPGWEFGEDLLKL